MHVRFTAQDFSRVLSTILSHTYKGPERPHLNAVCVELVEDDRITFIGTDGHRLAAWTVSPVDVVSQKKATSILISRREAEIALSTVKPFLKGDEHFVDLKTVARRISVVRKIGDREVARIALSPIDAQFPPVRNVLFAAKDAKPCVVALQSRFIVAACKAFADASSKGDKVPVQMFSKGSALEPVVFRAPESNDLHGLMIVVMPMRVETNGTWDPIPPAVVAKPIAEKAA